MTAEDEQNMVRQIQDQERQAHVVQAQARERAQKALTLEEAFFQIRQSTGVNTLEEMVEKFIGQSGNKTALEEEKVEAEGRLTKAKSQLEKVERCVDYLYCTF
jgi:hypothetical protein